MGYTRLVMKKNAKQLEHEVAERRRAEECLKASEKKFRSLTENLSIGVFRTSVHEEARLIYANLALAKIYGADSVEEIKALTIAELFYDPADRAAVLGEITTSGFLKTREILLRNKQGAPVWCSTNAVLQRTAAGNPAWIDGTLEDITERKKADEAIRMNELRLGTMVKLFNMQNSSIPEISNFVLHEAIRLTSSSIGYLAFLNDDETVLSMYAWSDSALKDCRVKDRPLVYRVSETGLWGETVRQRRPVITNDYSAPCPNKKGLPAGHVHITRHLGVPIFDADRMVMIVGVGNKDLAYDQSDIQQMTLFMNGLWQFMRQQKATEALQESQEKYHDLVEAANAVIIAWDSEGRIQFFNAFAQKLFGYTEEEVLGKSLMETIVPPRESTGRDLAEMIRAISRDDERLRENENENITKDGRRLWLRWTNKAIRNDQGDVASILSIGIDITDRKKAEEEVKAAQQQLIQADKLVALGTLVAGVAHEVNNPNNFVMLNTPILQDIWNSITPVLDAYYRENGDFKAGGMLYSEVRTDVPTLFTGILDGARRISGIVRELKDFARPDEVNMAQRIDLNATVQAAVNLLHNSIKKATRRFSVSYGDGLPSLTGNVQRLEQVFINLLLNACQALPDTDKAIHVATYREAQAMVVSVSDEGKGIARENLKQIMDPFFTTKRGAGGTGLGLSISNKIIQDHGGRIEVESGVQEGSCFKVYLPFDKPLGTKKILIADDDETIRTLLFTELSANPGYMTQVVASGTETCIMLGKWRPDLIILDINMPDMNGVEVCRKIKSDPDFASAKVIICTGHAGSAEMREIRTLGYTEVLEKPFKRREVRKAVKNIFAQ